jgi:hypothetical protein
MAEKKCLNTAREKGAHIRMTMFDLGKANDLHDVAKRSKIWIPELAKAIQQEQIILLNRIFVSPISCFKL